MPDPVTESVVSVREVTRSLPLGDVQIPVLNGVSFELNRGVWTALTGPSGSGKSTLLGIIGGLDAPSSGQVWLDGEEITRMDEGALARVRNEKVGFVFQAFNLIPTLTAQENVEVPLYVNPRRRQASKIARELLDLVGLSDRLRHLPDQLSGGEQQRVAIARALVTDPVVLLADEPTGNLDTRTGEQILDTFSRLQVQLSLTLFVVTHDDRVAARADERLHLVDGRLTQPLEVS